MNSFLLVVVAIVLALVGAQEAVPNDKKEPVAFPDNKEVETLIQDEKKFKEFFPCLMEQDPCPENLNKLKESMVKNMSTNCGECTPEQKEQYQKYMKVISEKYAKEYQALGQKYAPKPQKN